MDVPEMKKENRPEQKTDMNKQVLYNKRLLQEPINIETMKRFFRLTGGSLFYCISAVFVAYGIVNLMGSILSEGETLKKALPCIITLHAYELALLGVLILIVSRKVVDDAISVVIFIALFLIGTSMALGTVVDKDITMSFWIGLICIFLSLSKFFAMWRFVHIQFKTLSILGLGFIITYNYLSPTFLARSIAIDPTQEQARRNFWLLLSVSIIIGAGFVIFEAMKRKSLRQTQQDDSTPILQQPIMVYVFTLILIIASGVHQYAMAFTFALERVIGDYIPVILISTLLLIEILRHSGKKIGFVELGISYVPLAVTMLAIQQKSVLASGQFGFELLLYPPVILAISGLAIAALALYHRWYLLLHGASLYGLGVILTIGFSPANPYDLNMHACFGLFVVGLLIYGIVKRKQYICALAIIILCLGLTKWNGLSTFSSSYNLTEIGVLAGICGISFIVLYLMFNKQLNIIIRVIGVFCLAGFIFDYLPEFVHWKYIIVSLGTVFLMTGLWFRTRDILIILILWIPTSLRLFMLAKRIAHWRFVILGFFLLVAGTIVSLRKRPMRDQISTQEHEKG